MSDVAIRAQGLAKEFRIGSFLRYKTIRDTLTGMFTAPFHLMARSWNGHMGNGFHADTPFWALEDVSFEIKRGDVVGLIGQNGAGKSTLLKILSRITEPTKGWAELHGRVGSLLEVGTGFHPELTGRENVFLNGAILGLRKAEIDSKFDEIVAFAEVEKFIDTPVKHYSSGMFVRLAFAVAAHLETEILLVDEVLAVGDAAFQKKCLGKMGDVAKEGRTVLFVSHNMGVMTELCSQAILLDKGSIAFRGDIVDAVGQYMNMASDRFGSVKCLRSWRRRTGSGVSKITSARISTDDDEQEYLAIGKSLIVEFDVERDKDILASDLRFCVSIRTISGVRVLHTLNEDDGFTFPDKTSGKIVVRFPNFSLYPGTYSVSLWVGSSQYVDYDYVQDCLSFEVVQGDSLARAQRMNWGQGLVYLPSHWSME